MATARAITSSPSSRLSTRRRRIPTRSCWRTPSGKADVLAEADYIGSTAGIIKYAEESDASEFIIVTVRGVLYELERRCQGTGKKFYFPAVQPTCVNMDLITLEKLVCCLETGEGEVQIGVSDEAADQAKLTLDRMLEYAAR